MNNPIAMTTNAVCNPVASDYHFAVDLLNHFSSWSVETQIVALVVPALTIIIIALFMCQTLMTMTYHLLCCVQFGARKKQREEWRTEASLWGDSRLGAVYYLQRVG